MSILDYEFGYWFNCYTPDPDWYGEPDEYVGFNGYEYHWVSYCDMDGTPAQCVGPIAPPLQGPEPPSLSLFELMAP